MSERHLHSSGPNDIDPKHVGGRLRGAREAIRLTQDAVAKHLGVARTTIVAMEKGERKVQPSELLRLAKLYRRQAGEFLRQGEGAEPFAVQFRAPGAALEEVEPLDEILSEFQRLCEDYVELETLLRAPLKRNYPAVIDLAHVPEVDDLAEDLAVRERERLGLGDGPLGELREILEREVGLRVFYMEMPGKVSGLFGYHDALGGCIAVNVLQSDERCRHSLAHEYAHFLTSRFKADVTVSGRYQRMPASERFAIAFAIAFMLPAAGLRRRFLEVKAVQADFRVADVVVLASYYRVSVESLVRRLEGLRLLRTGTWERLQVDGMRVGDAQRRLGIESSRRDREMLPQRYLLLAVEAANASLLSEGQLARFLRTDRHDARTLLGAAHSASSPESRGDVAQAVAPLSLRRPMGEASERGVGGGEGSNSFDFEGDR